MKTLIRNIFILAFVVGPGSIVYGQTPQAIPYQAVARDVNGNLIANQNISLRFSIVDQYFIPTIFYQETQTATTNSLGLFTANFGQGTPVIGTFDGIYWGGGFVKYMKVEMDVTGGTNYINMGSSPLLSVPYALYSAKSGNGLMDGSAFGSTMYWNGVVWDNNTNIFNGGLNVGIGTSNPSTKLEVAGTTTTTNIAITSGAAPGYVLQSDANGNGNWVSPASIIGPEIDPQVSSATTNKVPKWNGTTLTDGSIYDDGKIGIGTTTPEFKLSLDNDGGIMAKGAYNSGATLTTSGPGTRMMWYPRKGAFRAGTVFGGQWDDINIGFGSFAAGSDNTAVGSYSTALGIGCYASGDFSFAQGNNNTASAYQAVAMGYLCTAYGIRSFAIGDQASANHQSRALGNNALATGTYAAAIGNFVTASGDYSSALGNYASTNGKNGSFSIGDNSSATPVTSSSNNSFDSRFAGGYRFFSDAATTPSKAMYFTSGKLGIGTSAPSTQLEVNGQVTIVDGNQAEGMVLTSDNNGTGRWAAASGGNCFTNVISYDTWLSSGYIFTIPPGVTKIKISVKGGGGGGRASDALVDANGNYISPGGGGGEGGYAEGLWDVTPGTQIHIHVGKGGAQNNDGEDSYVIDLIASHGIVGGHGFTPVLSGGGGLLWGQHGGKGGIGSGDYYLRVRGGSGGHAGPFMNVLIGGDGASGGGIGGRGDNAGGGGGGIGGGDGANENENAGSGAAGSGSGGGGYGPEGASYGNGGSGSVIIFW